jgi:PTH1 family peptidyl-tRNA hydrolase
MLLIIGLGNPEEKYNLTRHNVGFMLVDELQRKWEFPDFEKSKKFNAEISKSKLPLLDKERAGGEVALVKPQTFMNLSGTSVKAILDFYKLTPENIIVIHDDIDIELGKYKIATDSSSAGHNGVQNIIDQLGTKEFRRIRVGISKTHEEKESCPISAHDYVLGKFTPEELKVLKKTSENVLGEIDKFL